MKYAAFFVLTVLNPLSLMAQTFYGAGVTAQTSRQAGIYTPSSDNPLDALSLNPAGLSALSGSVVELSITGVVARGSFSNIGNADSPMRPNNGIVPFFALGTPLGRSPQTSKWSIAFGITPDLLSASKWQYNDVPGFGGADYGPQHEKSQILAFRGSAGIAYKIRPRLSVGATFGTVYNANTLDAPYIFQSNPDLAGLKTLLNLHTTGIGFNSSFGVIAQPASRWELNASYRTPTSITSSGTASGNMGQQFAALDIAFQPAFAYHAQVHVELPPSALFGIAWKATSATRLHAQTDWTGWHGSFNNLPVTLTRGTNADINTFLGSSGIKDVIPLDWKNQFTFRGSVDHSLGDSVSVSAGFLHGNNPVPNSTLAPLTAAIMKNGIAAGAGYKTGRWSFNFSYGFDFTSQASIGSSALLYDEYSNARTKIGIQALSLTTSFTL